LDELLFWRNGVGVIWRWADFDSVCGYS